MEFFVSFFCFFVLVPIAASFRASVSDPPILFAMFWGLMFFFYGLLPWLLPDFDFYAVSLEVAFYYVCLFAGFVLGCILSKAIFLKRRASSTEYRPRSMSSKRLLVYRILSPLSLIFIMGHLILNPVDLGAYFNAGALLRESQTLDYDAGGSPLILFSSYCAYAVLPVSIYFIVVGRERSSVIHWCPIFSLLVISFVSLAKYYLILTLVTVLAIWFQLNVRSANDLFKLTRPFLLTLVVVPTIFLASDILRQDSKGVSPDSSVASQLGFLMAMYGVGHINNFGTHLEREFDGVVSASENAGFRNSTQRRDPLFGERTFSGVFRIGHLIGVNDIPSYTRYEGVKGFNTFSVYRALVDDFGFRGAIIASSICGLLLQTLWYIFPSRSIAAYAARTYIIWMLVYSAIHSLFNFIFFPLVLLLLPIVCSQFRLSRQEEGG